MTRAILPHRRPSLQRACAWRGHGFVVTLGFDPAAADVREVFAEADKGGQLQATLSDACVLISLLLQHGVTPRAMAKSMGVEPDLLRGGGAVLPASPVGAVLAVVLAEGGGE